MRGKIQGKSAMTVLCHGVMRHLLLRVCFWGWGTSDSVAVAP